MATPKRRTSATRRDTIDTHLWIEKRMISDY